MAEHFPPGNPTFLADNVRFRWQDEVTVRTPKTPALAGVFVVWALEDSNLWPLPRQGSALPLS
jgi:hypothetical protein